MSNLSLNAQRVLLRAAELINVRASWSKGFYEHGDKYCAIGALQRAEREVVSEFDGHFNFDQAKKALVREVTELYRGAYSSVEDFNDDNGTAYEDVKALFCRTVSKHVDDPSLLEDNPDEPR